MRKFSSFPHTGDEDVLVFFGSSRNPPPNERLLKRAVKNLDQSRQTSWSEKGTLDLEKFRGFFARDSTRPERSRGRWHRQKLRGSQLGQVKRREQKSPWDTSLNEPVPQLIRMLVCDWAQKIILCPIRGQHQSIVLLSWSSYTKKFTCKLNCLPCTSLACEGELSLRRVFSESELPKFTLPVSFDPLVSLRRNI